MTDKPEGVWLWASDWGDYDERTYGIFRTEEEARTAKTSNKHYSTFGEVFFQEFGEV